MKSKLLMVLCLAAVVTVGSGYSSGADEDSDCGIRFEDNGVCACSSHDRDGPPLTCASDSSVHVQPCYCMYYDPTVNLSIVGHCFYSCYEFGGIVKDITSATEFNMDICGMYGSHERRGRFCGQCNDVYGLPAYSYQLVTCIPCPDYGYKNWLKYFAVAFLPLTVFYILAVLLSFNVTSSSLNGIVLVVQCILSPVQVFVLRGSYSFSFSHSALSALKAISSLFCTVNLDFFRLVYSPFCLHPKANIFQILSLDYLVALYSFLLIFMTYVLVTAYDKRYRLVVWMWRPVQWCVHRHRNTWNIHTSLIEIFATFILFSYVRILTISLQILTLTRAHDVSGKKLDKVFTYIDGTIEYFGPGHLPYALLAIAISSVFVVLPFLLLAVYPCRCFHKCLNNCGLRSQALHIFMDAFQGSFRTHPRDMRYFSAFYMLVRVLLAMQLQIFMSSLAFFTSGVLSFLAAAIIAIFRPYKVKTHNTIDAVLLILMGTYFTSFHAQMSVDYGVRNVTITVQGISVTILLLYFISLVLWKLRLGGKLQAVVGRAKVVWSSIVHHPREHSNRGEEIEPLDREPDTSGSNSYPPLLGGSQKPTY